MGFLIEADETGRKGQVTWAWTSPGGLEAGKAMGYPKFDVPNLAPISAYFNFDGNENLDPACRPETLTLYKYWFDNRIQRDPLMSIWKTVEHKPSDWGYSVIDDMIM